MGPLALAPAGGAGHPRIQPRGFWSSEVEPFNAHLPADPGVGSVGRQRVRQYRAAKEQLELMCVTFLRELVVAGDIVAHEYHVRDKSLCGFALGQLAESTNKQQQPAARSASS